MIRVCIPLSFLAFALLLALSPARAGTTGKITGVVTDAETAEPLPGANVIIEGTTMGAGTDIHGRYVILNVPPGLYTLLFSYVGYQTVRIKEVRVNVDFTTTLNAKLRATTIEVGPVEVLGERNPLVREDLTNTQVAVTAETIKELPVDAFQDVVRLQSGVTVDNTGAIHIRGGRSNEIAYTINGITIQNPFDNSLAVGIATNAIQELLVSSGTFSAEYGNALSGVINFVTKDGGPRYSGSFRLWTGDNVSTHDDVFQNIGEIDPFNYQRYEGTFGGPVLFFGKRLFFFSSGVYSKRNGYLYGKRLYSPFDGLDISGEEFKFDPLGDGKPSGDGRWVPMNTGRSTNFTTKLTFTPSPLFKITYDLILDDARSQSYERAYKFNPDGRSTDYSRGQSHSFGITHTMSRSTFYTLKGVIGFTNEKSYVFENPFDPRYVPYNLANPITPTGFLAGGTDLDRSRATTRTLAAKFDLVSQVQANHELKLGGEVRQHRLEREFYTLVYDTSQAAPIVPYPWLNPNYTDYVFYVRRPTQAAAYVLDKMELAKTFIVNAGLRYEYLNTAAWYNPDIANTDPDDPGAYLKEAKPKHRFSPRVSVSYPITDRGIIRFSYGHFYQAPVFADLYTNPRFETFKYTRTPTFGNANLKPERSIQYEMGLQQQLTEDLKIDVTAFYKDVTDLLQRRQVLAGTIAADRRFFLVSNVSYANVRGITFSLFKRRSPGSLFSATLDYTFQMAKGSRTDEEAFFFDQKSGKETERTFVFLAFDRTHTLNGTLTLSKPDNWNISAIWSFWSGTPYTPALPSSLAPVQFEENSARRPEYKNVDLRLEKYFRLKGLSISLFSVIENLFDFKNENFIWASSGRALFALEEKLNATQFNTLRQRIRQNPDLYFPESELDHYYVRPEWLSEPRRVRVGFAFEF